MTDKAPGRGRGRIDGGRPDTGVAADDAARGAPSPQPREADGGRDEVAAPPGADETVTHDVESVRARGGAVSPHDRTAHHDAPWPADTPRP